MTLRMNSMDTTLLPPLGLYEVPLSRYVTFYCIPLLWRCFSPQWGKLRSAKNPTFWPSYIFLSGYLEEVPLCLLLSPCCHLQEYTFLFTFDKFFAYLPLLSCFYLFSFFSMISRIIFILFFFIFRKCPPNFLA